MITPQIKTEGQADIRVNNKELAKLSDWSRDHILESELKNAQLQQKIPTAKKPIIKPDYW